MSRLEKQQNLAKVSATFARLTERLLFPNYMTALVCLLVFVVTLGVYFLTLAPTVTLVDSGELILACHSLGIAHPPGFPLYVLIGHLFTRLPFGVETGGLLLTRDWQLYSPLLYLQHVDQNHTRSIQLLRLNAGGCVSSHVDGVPWFFSCHRIGLDKSAQIVYHSF